MFSKFVLKIRSQGAIILGACFELVCTKFCKCPHVFSENTCLLSPVPKSESQEQLPRVLVYQDVPKQCLNMFCNGTCWKTDIHGLPSMSSQTEVFSCSERNALWWYALRYQHQRKVIRDTIRCPHTFWHITTHVSIFRKKCKKTPGK